jgi:ribosomal protein S18 acetylase RimI-like enzyme
MESLEQLELEIASARTDAHLEDLITVRRYVTPEARPTVENLRFNLDSDDDLVYLVAYAGSDPVGCGYVQALEEMVYADIGVAPAYRRRGFGGALLAEVRERARSAGRDEIQGEVRESETDARGFLERRGFRQVGAERAVALDLASIREPPVAPPEGVRIVSRAEAGDVFRGMFDVSVQAEEDIPGSLGTRTFEQWRAQEIDKPSRRPELCFIALAGDEVVGYAALDDFGDRVHHGLTATRRDWRRRGVASALKRAEIAAAKRAGFERLVTESEERNEPMRRLNEKLGFVPAPELSTIVMRGPVG